MSEQKYPIGEFFVPGGSSGYAHHSGLRLSFDQMIARGYSHQETGSRPAWKSPHCTPRRWLISVLISAS